MAWSQVPQAAGSPGLRLARVARGAARDVGAGSVLVESHAPKGVAFADDERALAHHMTVWT
jgi:hypothetical protein